MLRSSGSGWYCQDDLWLDFVELQKTLLSETGQLEDFEGTRERVSQVWNASAKLWTVLWELVMFSSKTGLNCPHRDSKIGLCVCNSNTQTVGRWLFGYVWPHHVKPNQFTSAVLAPTISIKQSMLLDFWRDEVAGIFGAICFHWILNIWSLEVSESILHTGQWMCWDKARSSRMDSAHRIPQPDI